MASIRQEALVNSEIEKNLKRPNENVGREIRNSRPLVPKQPLTRLRYARQRRLKACPSSGMESMLICAPVKSPKHGNFFP